MRRDLPGSLTVIPFKKQSVHHQCYCITVSLLNRLNWISDKRTLYIPHIKTMQADFHRTYWGGIAAIVSFTVKVFSSSVAAAVYVEYDVDAVVYYFQHRCRDMR